MRVLVKEVKPNVIDREDPNKVTSFWIYGLLKSGRKIRIFDSETFDLRKYENQELNQLIFCKLSNIPDDAINGDEFYNPVLEGEYIGEFKIPNNWKISWRFEPIKKEKPINFHAIQTENGILIVKPNNLKNYSVKPGERFKFKIVGFDLMAWEPIKGKNIIDPLEFEKKMIDKFWNVMESTRNKSNKDTTKQLIYLKMELLNWTYDEIWLFDDILGHLSIALSFNDSFYKEKLEASVHYITDFYQGIVALGKNVYKKALIEPKNFFQDILAKKYSEHPREIELNTSSLIQDVLEKKSGKSIRNFSEYVLREDIEEVRNKTGSILDQEFEIDWDKPTS